MGMPVRLGVILTFCSRTVEAKEGEGGMNESDICMKHTEAPAPLCFILTPLYYTDPCQMLTSCIITQYEPIFT